MCSKYAPGSICQRGAGRRITTPFSAYHRAARHRAHRAASPRTINPRACYQLSHPMLATEAMTRLAKAFDCLTSPQCKKAYDAAHFPHLIVGPPVLPQSRVRTAIASDTAETTAVPATAPTPKPAESPPENPIQWQSAAAPPPVRQAAEIAEPAPTTAVPEPAASVATTVPPPISAPAAPEKPKLLNLPPKRLSNWTRGELSSSGSCGSASSSRLGTRRQVRRQAQAQTDQTGGSHRIDAVASGYRRSSSGSPRIAGPTGPARVPRGGLDEPRICSRAVQGHG